MVNNRWRLGHSQPDFTDEDLDYIYVLVPRDDGSGTENLTIRQMSDRQFREWIVAFAAHHGVQILPVFGRIGMETRLAMLNRLVRQGIRIYRWRPERSEA